MRHACSSIGRLTHFGALRLEADARWRPHYGGFWRFTPNLYGQLFTGYGETPLS